MTQLRPSSIENEYFLGGLPGTIQYEMSKDEILQCIPENLEEINEIELQKQFHDICIGTELGRQTSSF